VILFVLAPLFGRIFQFKVLGIDLGESTPLFWEIVFGKDGFYRAFWFAGATINALIRIDIEYRLSFTVRWMNAINRTDLYTRFVLYINARCCNDISHSSLLFLFIN